MSNVTMRYFIAEGERAKAVAAEGLDRVNTIRGQRRALLRELGADVFYETRRHITGIGIFTDAPQEKSGFLKPEKHCEDGVNMYIYTPDKRTKTGKALRQQMDSLTMSNFSDFVCNEFGVTHSTIGPRSDSRSGMAMYSSVAGYVNNTLVFKIPFGGDQDGGTEITIPSDLREIKKSEFISITEEAA